MMQLLASHFLSRSGLLAGGLALSACSVVGSSPIVEGSPVNAYVGGKAGPLACHSTLGSYSLPKGLVHIKVSRHSGGYHQIEIPTENPVHVPENRHTFCLDHLSSGFADDAIRVLKDKSGEKSLAKVGDISSPFLSLIASSATDQSVSIIRKLLLTAFRIISRNPNFVSSRSAVGEGATTETVRDLTFDPFDPQELAEINASINGLGFCVILEDYSYDLRQSTPGAYCDDPQGTISRHPSPKAEKLAGQRYLVPKSKSGIFFRPRTDHAVSIYAKADPRGRERWRLLQRKWMAFENTQPIISVGVERAVFATRRTGLIFDDGMLRDVCIAKGSQVAGFINIPLDVVYGVIALPTQTIQGTLSRVESRKNLILAQNRLIAAQEAYIDYLGSTEVNLKGDALTKGNSDDLQLGNSDAGVPGAEAFKTNTSAGLTDRTRLGLSGNTSTLTDNNNILDSICAELNRINNDITVESGGARF